MGNFSHTFWSPKCWHHPFSSNSTIIFLSLSIYLLFLHPALSFCHCFSKYVCIQSHIIKMYSFSQISHIFQLFHSALQPFRTLYFNTEKWGISTDNECIKFHHSILFCLIMCCFFLKFDPMRTVSSMLMTPVSQILLSHLPECFLLNKKMKINYWMPLSWRIHT